MDIYVENLPPDLTEDELHRLFSEYGRVDSVNIMYNASTGKSKEFGYIEMPDPEEARRAIEALNHRMIRGREIAINELHTPPDVSTTSGGGI